MVRIPPLRERVEDIPLLIDQILKRLLEGNGGPSGGVASGHGQPLASRRLIMPAAHAAGLSKEALEMLLRYSWPGNVRELQNLIEDGLILATDGVIGVPELSEKIIDNALAESGSVRPENGKTAEQVMIETALEKLAGDKAAAARYAGWSPSVLEKTSVKASSGSGGLSRPKLYRVMVRYGLDAESPKRLR